MRLLPPYTRDLGGLTLRLNPMKVTIATTKFKPSSTPDYIDSTSYINVIAEE